MLTTTSPADTGFSTIDEMEQELIRLEGLISRVRARQTEMLSVIDRLQVPLHDGTRSLKEWITGRLDVHPRTASDLAVLTKADPGPTTDALAAGVWSTDRAAGMVRLENTGASRDIMDQAEGAPVSQLGRTQAKHWRMSDLDHVEAFKTRRMWFQPNLSNTVAHGSITMTGADVDLFMEALDRRADELVAENDPHRPALEQRRVDALVSLALDTITPGTGTVAPRRLRAHIFVDATEAACTEGRAGAITLAGMKIGPSTLDEIFCIGDTTTTMIDGDSLKAVPTDGDRLPQRVREYVFHRDRACTADGCTSRYRLEPHHIRPRSRGGSHHPDNLTLLCWFHHHVVVHQLGYRMDPVSPSKRRRFLPVDTTPDPPDD